ncbi:hypothetical protein B0J14DRAFT_561405 [Halenospora varia]|nr:hypothetical protein B0J14DRAFT_561405 [Halenospora varia]
MIYNHPGTESFIYTNEPRTIDTKMKSSAAQARGCWVLVLTGCRTHGTLSPYLLSWSQNVWKLLDKFLDLADDLVGRAGFRCSHDYFQLSLFRTFEAALEETATAPRSLELFDSAGCVCVNLCSGPQPRTYLFELDFHFQDEGSFSRHYRPGSACPSEAQLNTAYGYAIQREDGSFTRLIRADNLEPINGIAQSFKGQESHARDLPDLGNVEIHALWASIAPSARLTSAYYPRRPPSDQPIRSSPAPLILASRLFLTSST